MQYLIGGIIGGLFVGLWAYTRCRYYKELVELKRSEFKAILNHYGQTVDVWKEANEIAKDRLKVEGDAAWFNNTFGGIILSRKSRADDIADALGRIAAALQAKEDGE